MASPEGITSIGTSQGTGGGKKFLRYRDNKKRSDEEESDDDEEERKYGENLFKITKLDALAKRAEGLGIIELDGKVLKFFERLAKYGYTPYNYPAAFGKSDYDHLRKLYRTWSYYYCR